MWDLSVFLRQKDINFFFQSQAVSNAGIRPVTYQNAPLLGQKVLPSNKKFFFKAKKGDKFDWKTTRNTSRWQIIQGLDTNIYCLAVELSEWISSFVKPLKVILTKHFVLIKQNRNFKCKYDDERFKRKIISSLGS